MRYQNAFTRGCSYSVPRIYPFRNARLGRCFRGRGTITIFPDLSLLPQLYSRIVPRQLHFSLVPRVTFSSHSSRFTNDSFKRSLSIPLFSREIRVKKKKKNRLSFEIGFEIRWIYIFRENIREEMSENASGLIKIIIEGRVSLNAAMQFSIIIDRHLISSSP